MKTPLCILVLAAFSTMADAQLSVTVLPPRVTAQKVVVPLTMRNAFSEKVESARAAVFLLDEQGKMVANASRWVIGGAKAAPALAPGATNAFNFVVASGKPIVSTNLIAKVSFTRVVLEGGKLADANRDVQIQRAQR